jgi:hypothetical protein
MAVIGAALMSSPACMLTHSFIGPAKDFMKFIVKFAGPVQTIISA